MWGLEDGDITGSGSASDGPGLWPALLLHQLYNLEERYSTSWRLNYFLVLTTSNQGLCLTESIGAASLPGWLSLHHAFVPRPSWVRLRPTHVRSTVQADSEQAGSLSQALPLGRAKGSWLRAQRSTSFSGIPFPDGKSFKIF